MNTHKAEYSYIQDFPQFSVKNSGLYKETLNKSLIILIKLFRHSIHNVIPTSPVGK
jgi:hypothetical protein